MITLRTYLLDDDEIQLLYLQHKLQAFTNIEIIGMNTHATVGKSEIETLLPQLLFLDIDLVIANGLELYRSMHHKPILILATSLLDYALDGYELDAVDYLVKPYTAERLEKAITKANTYFNFQKEQHSNQQLQGDFMFVKDGTSLIKIKFDTILYIEALGDFSEIHISNGAKKVTLVNLKNLEMQLPSALFIRISRTVMIKINQVDAIHSNVVTIGGNELSIGKSYIDKAMEAITGNQIIKRNV